MVSNVLLFLLTFSFASVGGRRYVNCNEDCYPFASSTFCNVYGISNPPWSSNNATTAPSPVLHDPKFYTYNQNNCTFIALNLTWSSKVPAFKKLIQGYYLSVGKANMIGTYKYQVDVNKHIISSKIKRKRIYFKFECIGRNSNLIRPGDSVYVTLHSLPLYQSSLDSQSVHKKLRVPKCEQNEILNKTVHCRNKNSKYTHYDFDVVDVDKKDTILFSSVTDADEKKVGVFKLVLLAAIVGISLALMIIVAVFCVKTIFAKSGKQRCLVLVSNTSDSDSPYFKATVLLADILKKNPQLNVHCNLWELTGMYDPVKWTSGYLANFENIILIGSPDGVNNFYANKSTSKGLKDPFVMGVVALLNNNLGLNIYFTKTQTFYFVAFENKSKLSRSIPEELTSYKNCFHLMQKFNLFYQTVTKTSPKTADSQLCKMLIKTSKLIQVLSKKSYSTNSYCNDANSLNSETSIKEKFTAVVGSYSCNTEYDSGFQTTSLNTCCHGSSLSSCAGSQCSCNINSI